MNIYMPKQFGFFKKSKFVGCRLTLPICLKLQIKFSFNYAFEKKEPRTSIKLVLNL